MLALGTLLCLVKDGSRCWYKAYELHETKKVSTKEKITALEISQCPRRSKLGTSRGGLAVMAAAMDVDGESSTTTRAAVHVSLLPAYLQEKIQAVEGERFKVAVDEIAAEWAAAGDETQKLQNSLRWVSPINMCATNLTNLPTKSDTC